MRVWRKCWSRLDRHDTAKHAARLWLVLSCPLHSPSRDKSHRWADGSGDARIFATDHRSLVATFGSRQSHANTMTLFVIGLGLFDEKDITLRALEAVQSSERVYLEAYTSILMVEDYQERLVRLSLDV